VPRAEPQSEQLQRNPEGQIAPGQLCREVGLPDGAILDGRIVVDAGHDPQLMHAAVARTVGFVFEAHLADRPKLLFKGRDDVLLAEAVRNQLEHWIFRRQRRPLSGIGNQEAARATQGRLRMTQQALLGVVAGSETIGIGVELGKQGIELAVAGHRRAVHHVRAGVAGRFQLPGAIYAFVEGGKLVRVNRGTGRRVRADDRRTRNGDAPLLQRAGGVLKPAPHARILLRESRHCQQTANSSQEYDTKTIRTHIQTPASTPRDDN
jgi:hypothetical protein